MEGWIKLHRQIIESPVFAHQTALKIWIWCLCKANHSGKSFAISTGKGETIVSIQRGQFIFGRFKAEDELGINGSTVYKWMHKFSDEMDMINIENNTHYSIITILNFNDFQDIETDKVTTKGQPSNNQVTTKGQPSNNQVTTKGQPSNTYKNDKNDKNDKNVSENKRTQFVYGNHHDTKYFLIVPKTINSPIYRINGEDGMTKLFELNQSIIKNKSAINTFLLNNSGAHFNEFSHVYNKFNLHIEQNTQAYGR